MRSPARIPSRAKDEDVEAGGITGGMATKVHVLKTRLWALTGQNEVQDAMTYHAQDLASYSVLLQTSFTVWARRSLWMNALWLLVIAFMCACATLALVKDPAGLKVSEFAKISQFLNIFVGMLIGFFMYSSVTRWWACADGFLEVFETIRNLQMQFIALGVPQDETDRVLRFAVLSTWMLNVQLYCEALGTDALRKTAKNEMWTLLEQNKGEGLDETYAHMTPEEIEVMRPTEDPSCMLWVWVASLVGHLSEEGFIPAMASPTYGRIMTLCEKAHGGIRRVRSSITVQAPFIYVQMLASLVHINNIINALSFGLTLGASLGTLVQNYKHPRDATLGQVSRDGQSLLVSWFFSCFGPFIYQALLETAISIAQPFNNADGQIPTFRLLKGLESDLHGARAVKTKTPWTQPAFKK